MSLITTTDLLNDALRKVGEKIDGTSDYTDSALDYMNSFYTAILAGGNEFDVDLGDPWTWAKAKYPGVLTILPPYQTGVVTVTQGSSAGSFGTSPAASMVGRYLKLLGNSGSPGTFEYYRIIAHVGGASAFTLDGPFNDQSQTSPFQAMLLDYDLNAAPMLRQIGPMKVYRAQTSDADFEGKIVGLDMRSFEKKWPLYRIQAGVPTEFGVLSVINDTPTVRFNKFIAVDTNANLRVEYDYIPVPLSLLNDSVSTPIIPIAFRQCLSYATAYALSNDKEDTKAKTYADLAKAKLHAMRTANRREFMQISKNRGRLTPRGDDFGIRNYPTSGNDGIGG